MQDIKFLVRKVPSLYQEGQDNLFFFFFFFFGCTGGMWDCRPLTRDGTLTPCSGKYGALTSGPPGKPLNSLSLIHLYTCLLFGDLAVSGAWHSVQPKQKCDETHSSQVVETQDTICMWPNRE